MKLLGCVFLLLLISCQSNQGPNESSLQVPGDKMNISVPARFEPSYDGRSDSLSWAVSGENIRVSADIGRHRVQPVKLIFNMAGLVISGGARTAKVVITRGKSTFGYVGDVFFSQCEKKPRYRNKVLDSSPRPWDNGRTSRSFEVSIGILRSDLVNPVDSVCFEYQIELMAMDRPVEAEIIKAELIIQK